MAQLIARNLNEADDSTFADAPTCGVCGAPMLAGQKFNHYTCEIKLRDGLVTALRDKHWLSNEYHEYLRSAQWRKFRAKMIAMVGGRCEQCDVVAQGLHVHHVNYDRLGCEDEDDVLVLCPPCHDAEHRELDAERLFEARYQGWLRKRYPGGVMIFDPEGSRLEFEDWLDRQDGYA